MADTQEQIVSKGVREGLSQLSYKPTQYADSSWEIVGEFINQNFFEASGFEVVSESSAISDPMFADYGGIPKDQAKFRMHCPTGAAKAKQSAQEQDDAPDAIDPNKIILSEEELNKLLQEAENKGFETAKKDFLAQGEQVKEVLKENFTTVVHDLAEQLKEKIQEMEKKAVKFSVDMAEKLIGHAVEINPEYLFEIVKTALELTGGATVKKILVSPDDYEFLKLISLEKNFPDCDGTWAFEADASIKAGCVLETSSGIVNFDLNAAWERIKDSVIKAI